MTLYSVYLSLQQINDVLYCVVLFHVYNLNPECMAAMPKVRSSYVTPEKPTVRIM